MIAFASLTSRFLDLVGVVDITKTESARVGEVLNAAVALVFSEGVPGLDLAFTGETPGPANVTIAVHTAGSPLVTFDAAVDGILPRDLFVLAGKTYIILDVLSTTQISIGSPPLTALTGAGRVDRRGFALAGSGKVLAVSGQGSATGTQLAPLGPVLGLPNKANQKGGGSFSTGYAPESGQHFLSLVPTPTAGARFDVIQGTLPTVGADLNVPGAIAFTILFRAVSLWRAVNDEQNGAVLTAAQMAAKDVSDIRRTAGGSHGVLER